MASTSLRSYHRPATPSAGKNRSDETDALKHARDTTADRLKTPDLSAHSELLLDTARFSSKGRLSGGIISREKGRVRLWTRTPPLRKELPTDRLVDYLAPGRMLLDRSRRESFGRRGTG